MEQGRLSTMQDFTHCALGVLHILAGSDKSAPIGAASLSPQTPLSLRRAAYDRGACKHLLHDGAVHARFRPADSAQAVAFDLAEMLRWELCVAEKWPGVAANLAQSSETQRSFAQESPFLAVFFALRDAFYPAAAPCASADTRMQARCVSIAAEITKRRIFRQQEAFALCITRLFEKTQANARTQHSGTENKSDSSVMKTPKPPRRDTSPPKQRAAALNPTLAGALTPAMEIKKTGSSSAATMCAPEYAASLRTPYRIYSRAFDRTCNAFELFPPREIQRSEKTMQLLVQDQPPVWERHDLARLRRLLHTHAAQRDVPSIEQLRLDPRRFAAFIANPERRPPYKRREKKPVAHTLVTLLLDNSGSMCGRPIEMTALCAEKLAALFGQCQVAFEILGFTTSAWKGGQARQKWLEEGSPINPGRLNDRLHIVYKAASAPWRAARRALGVMLEGSLLKENLDGEALLWAYKRALHTPFARRIVVVISDGAPNDESTRMHNSESYLQGHLRSVITRIEREKLVELCAIGIGHDVGSFYRHALPVRSANELGTAFTQHLERLFAGLGGQTLHR